jgi:hypothetical protein
MCNVDLVMMVQLVQKLWSPQNIVGVLLISHTDTELKVQNEKPLLSFITYVFK